MDTRLMNLFMAGTESSLCIAFHYLINNGWDVSTAIDDYSSTFTSLKNAAKQSGTYFNNLIFCFASKWVPFL